VSGEPFTLDRFLGGRLVAAQPKGGFRAGHDTVLLAAAVPAQSGERVLELGAGAGVASLCLAARVSGVQVLGIEIDAALVSLGNENAASNGLSERVRFEQGDAACISRDGLFDHVFFNPPFHPISGQQSPNPARARAMRSEDALAQWTRVALQRTTPGGTVTAIVRADRANEMAVQDGAVLFPLFPHEGEAPKRAIVHIVKGSNAPLRQGKGLILHEKDGRNSDAVEAVLRHGTELRLV
jgi:tRNA1Val (adenine37-N6)-methyltransferase